MVHLLGELVARLRQTWFGSVLALLGFALLLVVPVSRQCFGIAAVKGGVGGVFCSWRPPLDDPQGGGLVVLLAFAGVIILAPLIMPSRPVLIASAIATTAVVLAIVSLTSISLDVQLALSRSGLDFSNEARSGFLALLPASAAWVAASFRLR